MSAQVLALIICILFLIPDEGHVLPSVEEEPLNIRSLPAVVTVYDPSLPERYPDVSWLAINCDNDCSTVATGPIEDWMYESAGACDQSLLGATIHFPLINFSMDCVDNGSDVRAMYSEHHQQWVLFFDAMWHLDLGEDEEILGAPDWNYWYLNDWYVTWN